MRRRWCWWTAPARCSIEWRATGSAPRRCSARCETLGGAMTTGNRWLRDGLIVGLIAYAAVAVFYSAFDLLASRGTLFTVNVLGQALFKGLRDPSVLQFP